MKTKVVVLIIAVALFGLFNCRKNSQEVSNVETNSTVKKKDLRPILQKDILLNPQQTTSRIKTFRSFSKTTAHKEANLIEADSIALDSSIFVVEAALNYEYDYLQDSTYEYETDTSEYTTAINEADLKVRNEDLEESYEQLRSFVSAKIDGNVKVALIDVEAFFSGSNRITYRAITSYFDRSKRIYCWYLDDANYSGDAAFYTGSCTPLIPDAVPELQKHLNCVEYWCGEGLGFYYSNVTTYTFSGANGSYSAALSYAPYNSMTWHCSNPVVISQATLYSKIAACYYLTNSNAPSGKVTAHRGVQSRYVTSYGTPTLYGYYWAVVATYATRNCLTWPRD